MAMIADSQQVMKHLMRLSSAPRGKRIKIKKNEVARDEQTQSHRSFLFQTYNSFQLFFLIIHQMDNQNR